ncbi:hypothetical protein [Bacillus phage Megatron]|uniref:Uncharacterized protein n=5 Tax=Wphvirus megatron TaxID=1987728 RepID=A0A024B3P7_9CAUD|nr:terminase large subunit [Bacillus phage Megatron]YP_009212019.1 hypothetical protein QLX47_gp079 [Bacillus phage Eyuki]YP_009280879.1 terminase large subunit [Bacillus phage SageFayge]YP_009285019.1 terminase large subunit [Bacillus phage DirtyBetty]YP_009286953.1 terminase large subunit [Bacillus phage Nemo]ANI24691.1 hypothetical protein SMUDGE_72 [Bacillus phage Smudge]ASR78722.1 hypothetical protein BUBS_78 [Bacillus phage Bubs]AHZ10653.1 hypothetical protein [Bacillus phage Megatron]
MQKRPWHIDINPEPVYGPMRVVKKSRAMGLSEMKLEDYNVLAKERGAIFNNVVLGIPYDRKEDSQCRTSQEN